MLYKGRKKGRREQKEEKKENCHRAHISPYAIHGKQSVKITSHLVKLLQAKHIDNHSHLQSPYLLNSLPLICLSI